VRKRGKETEMGFRVRAYTTAQTLAVALLGYVWLFTTDINLHVPPVLTLTEFFFGLAIGVFFCHHITSQELRALTKHGTTTVPLNKWVAVSVLIPVMLALNYYLTASTMLTVVLLFCALIPFITAGGATRVLQLAKWETVNQKIIVSGFNGNLYTFPKIPPLRVRLQAGSTRKTNL
jgi:hypothetical protein